MTSPIHFHRPPWLILVMLAPRIECLHIPNGNAIPSDSPTRNHICRSTTPNTPIATQTATLRVDQITLVATYYATDPMVPILTYHHFKNDDPEDVSDSMKVKYSDFRTQLQSLVRRRIHTRSAGRLDQR